LLFQEVEWTDKADTILADVLRASKECMLMNYVYACTNLVAEQYLAADEPATALAYLEEIMPGV
jgi:hypothetical protein